MPLILAIVIIVAVGLMTTLKVVRMLDYARDHPGLETRKRELRERYASTDMQVDEYERELDALEKEET